MQCVKINKIDDMVPKEDDELAYKTWFRGRNMEKGVFCLR